MIALARSVGRTTRFGNLFKARIRIARFSSKIIRIRSRIQKRAFVAVHRKTNSHGDKNKFKAVTVNAANLLFKEKQLAHSDKRKKRIWHATRDRMYRGRMYRVEARHAAGAGKKEKTNGDGQSVRQIVRG